MKNQQANKHRYFQRWDWTKIYYICLFPHQKWGITQQERWDLARRDGSCPSRNSHCPSQQRNMGIPGIIGKKNDGTFKFLSSFWTSFPTWNHGSPWFSDGSRWFPELIDSPSAPGTITGQSFEDVRPLPHSISRLGMYCHLAELWW